MARELDFICDECFHKKRDEEAVKRAAEDNCITEEKSSKCVEVNKINRRRGVDTGISDSTIILHFVNR